MTAPLSIPLLAFFLLVFAAAFFLVRALAGQIFGDARLSRRAVLQLGEEEPASKGPQLLRRPHLERLTPLEKRIEGRRELRQLRRLAEQAGLKVPAYRLLAEAAMYVLLAAVFLAFYFPRWWAFVLLLPVVAAVPVLRLLWLRQRRIRQIESQLADAIDMVKRSLRAGNPLVSTFRTVAENLDGPLAAEFGLTAADLSYGSDPRSALLAMLERVPSMPLMGFITAILVQRETGGNLAETLDHISAVIRERFRFDRKLLTLSAEGRLSAWILTLIPFVLAAVLHLRAPDYLQSLIDNPQGPSLIAGAVGLMVFGVLWMRSIVRISI
jgi:tight adherence protein B